MSDDDEPIGSCRECGADLYEGDDDELCDQCSFPWGSSEWDGPPGDYWGHDDDEEAP